MALSAKPERDLTADEHVQPFGRAERGRGTMLCEKPRLEGLEGPFRVCRQIRKEAEAARLRRLRNEWQRIGARQDDAPARVPAGEQRRARQQGRPSPVVAEHQRRKSVRGLYQLACERRTPSGPLAEAPRQDRDGACLGYGAHGIGSRSTVRETIIGAEREDFEPLRGDDLPAPNDDDRFARIGDGAEGGVLTRRLDAPALGAVSFQPIESVNAGNFGQEEHACDAMPGKIAAGRIEKPVKRKYRVNVNVCVHRAALLRRTHSFERG